LENFQQKKFSQKTKKLSSKISFDSIKDLWKMQELIVYCFDEVNKMS